QFPDLLLVPRHGGGRADANGPYNDFAACASEGGLGQTSKYRGRLVGRRASCDPSGGTCGGRRGPPGGRAPPVARAGRGGEGRRRDPDREGGGLARRRADRSVEAGDLDGPRRP